MKKYIILIGVLAFACGNQPKQKTLEFWQFWTDPKAKPVIENVVAQFEKEYPEWKINVTDLTWTDGHQKIVVAFGAGKPPDLLELGSDWIAEFAAANALSEIPGDTSGMLMLSPGVWQNKIFAWPWLLDTRVIYFNKTLLEKAGVQIPADWEQLLQACQKIQLLGDSVAGFGANSNEPHRLYKKFLPFVWSAGGDITDEDEISIDTPELERALQFYRQLAQCGWVETQKNLEDAFCEGKIGFVISGGWLLKRLADKPPSFTYELSPITPENTGGQGLSFAGGEYLVIPEKSANKEGAIKLLQALTSMANSQLLCDSVGFGFPPYGNQQISDKQKIVLFEQLRNSQSTPSDPDWVNIEGVIETMIEEVTLSKMTPKQAIENAQKKIDEIKTN